MVESGGQVLVDDVRSAARLAIVAGLNGRIVASLASAEQETRAIQLLEEGGVLLLATIRLAITSAAQPRPLEKALRIGLGFVA